MYGANAGERVCTAQTNVYGANAGGERVVVLCPPGRKKK